MELLFVVMALSVMGARGQTHTTMPPPPTGSGPVFPGGAFYGGFTTTVAYASGMGQGSNTGSGTGMTWDPNYSQGGAPINDTGMLAPNLSYMDVGLTLLGPELWNQTTTYDATGGATGGAAGTSQYGTNPYGPPPPPSSSYYPSPSITSSATMQPAEYLRQVISTMPKFDTADVPLVLDQLRAKQAEMASVGQTITPQDMGQVLINFQNQKMASTQPGAGSYGGSTSGNNVYMPSNTYPSTSGGYGGYPSSPQQPTAGGATNHYVSGAGSSGSGFPTGSGTGFPTSSGAGTGYPTSGSSAGYGSGSSPYGSQPSGGSLPTYGTNTYGAGPQTGPSLYGGSQYGGGSGSQPGGTYGSRTSGGYGSGYNPYRPQPQPQPQPQSPPQPSWAALAAREAFLAQRAGGGSPSYNPDKMGILATGGKGTLVKPGPSPSEIMAQVQEKIRQYQQQQQLNQLRQRLLLLQKLHHLQQQQQQLQQLQQRQQQQQALANLANPASALSTLLQRLTGGGAAANNNNNMVNAATPTNPLAALLARTTGQQQQVATPTNPLAALLAKLRPSTGATGASGATTNTNSVVAPNAITNPLAAIFQPGKNAVSAGGTTDLLSLLSGAGGSSSTSSSSGSSSNNNDNNNSGGSSSDSQASSTSSNGGSQPSDLQKLLSNLQGGGGGTGGNSVSTQQQQQTKPQPGPQMQNRFPMMDTMRQMMARAQAMNQQRRAAAQRAQSHGAGRMSFLRNPMFLMSMMGSGEMFGM